MLRLRLAGPKDGLRWTTHEQWHITLRFFGEIAEEGVPEVVSAIRGLRTAPVRLRMEQLGSFAVKGILFAELVSSPELIALQAQVESVAARCGLIPESRPFHPHITLARSRNRTGLATLRKLTTPEPPALGSSLSWDADKLWLYKSELQLGGAQYLTLADVPLSAKPLQEPTAEPAAPQS